MTSANLLVVVLVALVVGALTGLALSGLVSEFTLAIISGLLATLVASIVRNTVIVRLSGGGPDNSRIPMLVIVFACVASLAGSLAALELGRVFFPSWPTLLGTLAGLFSSILMSMLMITYHMYPDVP